MRPNTKTLEETTYYLTAVNVYIIGRIGAQKIADFAANFAISDLSQFSIGA